MRSLTLSLTGPASDLPVSQFIDFSDQLSQNSLAEDGWQI